jgi:hypothetical protein
MSFSFSASGNTDEVVTALKAITDEQLGKDVAGMQLRDFIAHQITLGSDDLEAHQVYVVRAHGHSGGRAGFTLSATVELGDRQTNGAELAEVADAPA